MSDFNPTMPHAVPLPWPAPWDGVTVVYDLYACEAFLDAEPTVLAEALRTARALQARLREIEALPDADARQAALDAWTADQRAARHARALAEVAYYVLRVAWPDGTDGAGADPATWARFPLRLLEWVTGEGYAAARDALWAHPKALAPEPSS